MKTTEHGTPNTADGQGPTENDNRSRAIVIGAGFGGLAAAVRLLVRGYDVEIVDNQDQAGGRARVFRQDGFTFDAGPTVITAPFLLEDLWTLAGKKMSDYVDIRPVSPFYRIRFDDGKIFDYSGDTEAMKEQIALFNPSDVRGYEKFLKKSEAIFKVGFEDLAHVPFGKVIDMLKIVPQMIKLESHRTVYGLVSKYIKNEKLRQVFSFHPLLVGGNPFTVTSIYTLIAFLEKKWGVHYAMGGTGVVVQGLVDLIEGLGGKIRLGTAVVKINTSDEGAPITEHGSQSSAVRDQSSGISEMEGNRRDESSPNPKRRTQNAKPRVAGVTLSDGTVIQSSVVVSNADFAKTYLDLLKDSPGKRWTPKRVGNLKYSMGLFVWYFGTDQKYEDIVHHTILIGPRYKGMLTNIFKDKTLAEDFSLYLHRPSATDPSMAPEGGDVFYVLSPVPHLESGTDWAEQSEIYRKKVEEYLEQSVMPELSKRIVTSRTLAPHEFQSDYLAYKGAAFSVEPTLAQSAYFRPHNKSEDFEGLYLVGAGTHPGAGIPGVISSARVLDLVVPDPARR